MPEFYRVREPFAFTGKDGVPRVLTAGEIVPSDHPDLTAKRRELYCERVGDYVARNATETATAAPGEARTFAPRRGRSKKSTAPEPVPPVSAPSDNTESDDDA